MHFKFFKDGQAFVCPLMFLDYFTDERVRNQQAPFDHPQIFISSKHPNDENSVVVDSGHHLMEFNKLKIIYWKYLLWEEMVVLL